MFTSIPEYFLRAILASTVITFLMGLLSPLISFKGLAFLTHAAFHSLLLGGILGVILTALIGGVNPTWTALIVTVLTVLAIAALETSGLTSDTATGIVSSLVAGLTVLGFGALYVIAAKKQLYGFTQNIVSYLIGEVFLLTVNDLLELAAAGLALTLTLILLYRDFLYVSFDPEGLASCGGNTKLYLTILYAITGAAAAVIVKTTGLITLQVIAILPGAIALKISRKLKKILVYSIAITGATQYASLIIAKALNAPPSGVATILLAAAYGIVTIKSRKT